VKQICKMFIISASKCDSNRVTSDTKSTPLTLHYTTAQQLLAAIQYLKLNDFKFFK